MWESLLSPASLDRPRKPTSASEEQRDRADIEREREGQLQILFYSKFLNLTGVLAFCRCIHYMNVCTFNLDSNVEAPNHDM